MSRSLILALVLSFALSVGASAQTPRPQGPPGARRGGGPGGPGSPAQALKPGELKKYEDVITKEAKSQTGMFKVDRIGDKVYWEIPTSLIGRELLWQTEVAQLPHSVSYPGTSLGIHVVRFTRRNNTVYLRDCNFDTRAFGPDKGVKTGVEENTIEPILMAFPMEAENADKGAVIDVTGLFTTDTQPIQVGGPLGLGGVDPSRSYIDRVKAFPENIETRSMLTFNGGAGGARRRFGGGGGGVASVIVHYSLDLLPETPMRGRYKDTRIGFFTTEFYEYGRSENRASQKQYISRFRLEKKDPKAEVSEPIKPIVFYLSKEVPAKWRPYFKLGIEDWQPVFEKAGYKNAIFCKDAPDDPNWDPEDARYNVVRWAPSQTENAMGASIQDPRSGETISAHAIFWNDLVRLLEDWRFAQTAAADPTARILPMPDKEIGAMLRYVVEHEIGHTLGLEHNFKASVAYTVKQLRDPAFMKTHGTAASVMSYSRFDYVAQAGDGVDPEDMANRIGPYDYFAILYGYKDYPKDPTPDLEKPELDALLAQQIDHPELRFGNYLYPGIDPGMQSENISDDPVEAGKLGIHNIYEIADSYLLPSTTVFGEDYQRLAEMEQNLMNQRFTELLHAAPLIGGVVQTDYHAGRGGEVFKPVPADKQAAAVDFITKYGFTPPYPLLKPEIVNRLEPTGIFGGVASQELVMLYVLLSPSRIARLEDNEAQNGPNVYTVARLVTDVSNAVWNEVDSPMPKVDVYKRQLQRSYLKLMDDRINGDSAINSDLRSLEKDDLQRLARRIDKAVSRTKDNETNSHLEACRTDIERILENKYTSPAGGFDANAFARSLGIDPGRLMQPVTDDECWSPDATIRQTIQELMAEEKPKAATEGAGSGN